MGGHEMAPHTPPTFGAPRRSRGAPLSPARFGSRDMAIHPTFRSTPAKPWRSSFARPARQLRHGHTHATPDRPGEAVALLFRPPGLGAATWPYTRHSAAPRRSRGAPL